MLDYFNVEPSWNIWHSSRVLEGKVNKSMREDRNKLLKIEQDSMLRSFSMVLHIAPDFH